MPRFNVQHPVTKEWRCFSTTVDDYVTDWMDEERYQKWRLHQYGQNAGEIRDANLMDYEEAEQIITDRKRWEAEDEVGRERDMKYILEIKPEYEAKGIMILGARDSHLYVTTLEVKDLEELNSDYINEHFGWLQDDAYQRGLDDAWAAARKIADMWGTMDNDDLLETFGVTAKIGESVIGTLFKKQTANEAMLELEAYEEKQKTDNCIEIGDEVKTKDGKRFVVTTFGSALDGDIAVGVCADGFGLGVDLKELHKTGRHFDISSILKEMQS